MSCSCALRRHDAARNFYFNLRRSVTQNQSVTGREPTPAARRWAQTKSERNDEIDTPDPGSEGQRTRRQYRKSRPRGDIVVDSLDKTLENQRAANLASRVRRQAANADVAIIRPDIGLPSFVRKDYGESKQPYPRPDPFLSAEFLSKVDQVTQTHFRREEARQLGRYYGSNKLVEKGGYVAPTTNRRLVMRRSKLLQQYGDPRFPPRDSENTLEDQLHNIRLARHAIYSKSEELEKDEAMRHEIRSGPGILEYVGRNIHAKKMEGIVNAGYEPWTSIDRRRVRGWEW